MIDPWSPDNRGLVKICGLREPEHAVAAVESGANLIGFVFAPSTRQVDHGRARDCVEAVRSAVPGDSVLAVGVFVDASIHDIESAIEAVGLDAVQLHGSSPLCARSRLRTWIGAGNSARTATRGNESGSGPPVVQAIPTPPGTNSTDVLRRIAAQRAADAAPVAWFIDGYRAGKHGGTGMRADWNLAADVAAKAPLILAGGLTPDNVANAIQIVRPLGVDVSGGVETDGRKDPAKIAAFVAAARAAFDGAGTAHRSSD